MHYESFRIKFENTYGNNYKHTGIFWRCFKYEKGKFDKTLVYLLASSNTPLICFTKLLISTTCTRYVYSKC